MNLTNFERRQTNSDPLILDEVIISESPYGLGVFAVIELNSGQVVRLCKPDDIVKVKITEVPEDKRHYLQYIDNVWCYAPSDLNSPAPAWLVNHSDKPNLIPLGNGEYKVVRHVAKGEELFIDYKVFDEPINLRDEFYR